jgi:hypothetical protein
MTGNSFSKLVSVNVAHTTERVKGETEYDSHQGTGCHERKRVRLGREEIAFATIEQWTFMMQV